MIRIWTTITSHLRRLGWFRSDLAVRVVERHPGREQIEPNVLLLVHDGKVDKWACFDCPGGCGERISLSLNPARRPAWRLRRDWLSRPTLEPSVHQRNACRCHFWICDGSIVWCKDGRPRQVHTG
jgi:hypothetical protein